MSYVLDGQHLCLYTMYLYNILYLDTMYLHENLHKLKMYLWTYLKTYLYEQHIHGTPPRE